MSRRWEGGSAPFCKGGNHAACSPKHAKAAARGSGGFQLAGLSAGHYEVRAQEEGYRERRAQVIVPEAGRARVIFRLLPE